MCENCGAQMRLSRDEGVMICDYCGSQAAPATDEEGVLVLEPTKHECPVCTSIRLANASLEAHELLYCTNCRGMLLEMEKFLTMLAVLREHRYWSRSSMTPRDFDAARVLYCPLCGLAMDAHPYGGGGNVAVDSCEGCGVLWLDRGELSRIVAAPDRDADFSPEVHETANPSALS